MALSTLTAISSCQLTPGIEEPATFLCTILDDREMDCVHTYDPNTVKKLSLIDGIGFTCVSPKGFGDIKSHHEILHEELNQK